MSYKVKKAVGLVLSAIMLLGTVGPTVNADEKDDEIKVVIKKTDIKADGVFNSGGYGSLKIKEVYDDNAEIESYPQAALIDRNGEFVFPYKETWLTYSYDNEIISLVPDYLYEAYTLKDGKSDPIGYYNLDGSEAFSIDCWGGTRMCEGKALIQEVKGDLNSPDCELDVYLIDKSGNRITSFNDGLFNQILADGGNDYKNELYGCSAAAYYGNGLLLCWYTEGGCDIFYKDAEGNTVIELEPNYGGARVFIGGYAAVQYGNRETGKWGYINPKGEVVIPCEYDNASDFYGELAGVSKDGKWGYINSSNEVVIPFEYDAAYGAVDGLAAVVKDGKCGLVDYDNNVIVPLEYDDISSFDEGVAYAIKDGVLYIITEDTGKIENPFTDVKDDAYYFNAVLWAVEKDITKGTTATTFSPDNGCTRGQFVTFLWRASGCPEPKGTSKFSDVKDSEKYYYKPVIWAAENGITTGTSATTFEPDKICTREQCVTFLYRAANNPQISEEEYNNFSFSDVTDKSKFYYDPITWAANKGITTGLKDKANRFGVGIECSRGTLVTFLYRAFN